MKLAMRTLIKISIIFVYMFSSCVFAQYHYCPSPDVVKANENNVQAWEHEGLFWSITYRGWPYAEKIGFDQVFYYPESNRLDCRYKWMNPKEPGTYLWTSVELSPDADTTIVIAGKRWEVTDNFFMCHAGRTETCAFELKTQQHSWFERIFNDR